MPSTGWQKQRLRYMTDCDLTGFRSCWSGDQDGGPREPNNANHRREEGHEPPQSRCAGNLIRPSRKIDLAHAEAGYPGARRHPTEMASCRIETLADSNASREATHGRNLTALGCVGH